MSETEITARAVYDLGALPHLASSLFGPDVFSTRSWYETVCGAAIPDGGRAVFVVLERQGDTLAIVPMLETAGGFGSLTTPYTCLWHPLLAPTADPELLQQLGRAFGAFCRRHAVTRLDAMDADAAWMAPFIAGAERAGLKALPFAHFGNWHGDVRGLSWQDYLAGRPGKLRETIRRRTRRLMEGEGGSFEIIDCSAGLQEALRIYEEVYARSWKEPEPFETFNPTLMRACAADGTLRLGILRQAGEPIAVQFWMVSQGWAGVQKLAHDEARKAVAPGTVLTGLMIRHLLEKEQVVELDFGRGDDPYKQDWTGERRQRVGLLLAHPFRTRGLAAVVRQASASFLKKRSKKLLDL